MFFTAFRLIHVLENLSHLLKEAMDSIELESIYDDFNFDDLKRLNNVLEELTPDIDNEMHKRVL